MTLMERFRAEYTEKKPTLTKPNREWQVYLVVDSIRIRVGENTATWPEAERRRTSVAKALMRFLQIEEKPR